MSYFDEEVARALAEQIKAVRKEKGISQEELAFRACLHRTEVGMIERGVRLPKVHTLIQIAGALGVGVAELVGHLTWHPPGPATGAFEVTAPEGREEHGGGEGR